MSKAPFFEFSLQEFLDYDAKNTEITRESIKEHLVHFKVVAEFYCDMHSGVKTESLDSDQAVAQYLYFSGSFVNLTKAFASLYRGHLLDANIFTRKTLESIRYSIFFRENPDKATLWFKTIHKSDRKKFDKSFRKWLDSGGDDITSREMPNLESMWDVACNLGPHANYSLSVFQNSVIQNGENINFKLWFHDLEPNEAGHARLVQSYYWHLIAHYESIRWWLIYSSMNFNLTEMQKKFFFDQFNRMSLDAQEAQKTMPMALS